MADSQSFLNELCQVLELPEPEPTQADESHNNYVFEKAANFNNGDGTFSDGRLDLYRQKSFVLESKQGAERRANELAAALASPGHRHEATKAPQGDSTARNRIHSTRRRSPPRSLGNWPTDSRNSQRVWNPNQQRNKEGQDHKVGRLHRRRSRVQRREEPSPAEHGEHREDRRHLLFDRVGYGIITSGYLSRNSASRLSVKPKWEATHDSNDSHRRTRSQDRCIGSG